MNNDQIKKLKILVVEDDPQQRNLVSSILKSVGYEVEAVESAESAILALKSDKGFELVFSDWKLGSMTGMEVLKYARQHRPDIGFAIATAYGTIAHAVDAIEAGADDYLSKPFQRQELLLCINKIANAYHLRRTNSDLNTQLSNQGSLVDLVGSAPCMQKVYERIERVSATSATVLITGESGTGKELTARALHKLSDRNSQAFIAVNCGAIPESLAEAELFGARKGAFTGAVKDSPGLLLSADKGTLFLDEVGELSQNVQTKLLRFLQEGTITPVGDNKEIKVDARVITATHRNLLNMVKDGTFREDLYYRLNIVPIDMPPLRNRREDIPSLVQFFLKKFEDSYGFSLPDLSKTVLQALLDYSWPGNVRELSNRIERLVLLGDESALIDELSQIHDNTNSTIQNQDFEIPDGGINWELFEKQCLQQALDKFNGNRAKAAQLLGMSYKTFDYRARKFALI